MEEEEQEPVVDETGFQKFKGFLSVFIPTREYIITPVIVNINIIIYIAMVASGINFFDPDSDSMIKWGANFRPYTIDGEWWRLFTSCFLHFGILHILMNMYALLSIGGLLESYLGKARFLSAYILTGIGASLVSLWWHDNVVSAGASGAIFGVYGVFLAMLTTDFIDKEIRDKLLPTIGSFVAYNLAFGMIGNIDNAAHIGGLITGLITGYAFVPGLKDPDNFFKKVISILGIVVLIVACSFSVIKNLSDDMKGFESAMQQFSDMESQALEVYQKRDTLSKENLKSELKNRGISNWNRSIQLLDSVNHYLSMPKYIQERNKTLRHYCELRISSYKLMYKGAEEETDKYDPEIEKYDSEIHKIIEELKK